jgi:hypothetical protein
LRGKAEGPAPAPAAPPAAPIVWTWESAAAALYLAAAGLVLGRWLFGWLALRRLLATAAPVTGRAAAVFAEAAGGRPPRLLASPRVRAPFSCGLLRPAVVLPAAFAAGAPAGVLRWVFAHELAHLRRRDAWAGLLFGLGQALFFAVPWFWWLRRQARLCQEYLADAAAVAAGGSPEEYAEFLLSWTAAPPAPALACGVRARPSDLYRRIQMLLKTPTPLEGRCPRRWALAAAGGLLSLAVLAAGFTLRAAAAPAPAPPEPKKEEPKKDEPKPDQPKKEAPVPDLPAQPGPDFPPLPDVDELLKSLPPNASPEQAKQYRQQMEEVRKQMQKVREQLRQQGGAFPGGGVGFAGQGGFVSGAFSPFSPQGARLGAFVQKPDETLVEQLDLPKDQGLVLTDVTPDSAAAKAGLKAHDVLLELNGKAVSSDVGEFVKQLNAIKADEAVDAVVLRKGKKETVKGLKLPEAKAEAPGAFFPGGPPNFNVQPPPLPPVPPIGFNPGGVAIGVPGGGLGFAAAGGNGVMTSTFRSNDRFTTRHQEGSLIITVTGKVADGKTTVGEISVQDGNESEKYENVDKVPEKYRDKVKNLIEMTEKGNARIEIKSP